MVTVLGRVEKFDLLNSHLIFYFLFTIVIKVLISCTEKPKFFIEVLDELEHWSAIHGSFGYFDSLFIW
jgi:hypothetical protein